MLPRTGHHREFGDFSPGEFILRQPGGLEVQERERLYVGHLARPTNLKYCALLVILREQGLFKTNGDFKCNGGIPYQSFLVLFCQRRR